MILALMLAATASSVPAPVGERLWPEDPAKTAEADRWLADRAGFHLGPGVGLSVHGYGAFGAVARVTANFQLGRLELRLTGFLGMFDLLEAGAEFSATTLRMGAEASVRVHLLDALALGVGTVQSVDGVISTVCTANRPECAGNNVLSGSFSLAVWPLALHFGQRGQHQVALAVTYTFVRPAWPRMGTNPVGAHLSYDLMF